jgi:hypothetical protein
MAAVDPKSQILLRLIAITAADLSLAGWIVWAAIKTGMAPDTSGFRRDRQPLAFWLSLALVVAIGLGFVAALAYAVLV